MIFKDGVSIEGIKPEAWALAVYADQIWKQLGREEGVTITSGTDGRHSTHSLHYRGLAFDLRTRYFTESQKKQAKMMLEYYLGPDYYVLIEKTHIHAQYTHDNVKK